MNYLAPLIENQFAHDVRYRTDDCVHDCFLRAPDVGSETGEAVLSDVWMFRIFVGRFRESDEVDRFVHSILRERMVGLQP